MTLLSGRSSMDLEIKRTLVASTAHTVLEDYGLLDEAQISTESYEYGTRIYLCSDYGRGLNTSTIVDHVSKFSFSEGLKLLVLFAVSSNCSWLELDTDGPIYEEFPEYDW